MVECIHYIQRIKVGKEDDSKMRNMRISQQNHREIKMLAAEYNMSMNSVLTVLLKKMKEK